MKALEAREKALSVVQGKNSTQYIAILKEIEKSVEKGTFEARYYTALTAGVKLKLEKDGYNINSYSDQRYGTTVTITW